MSRPDFIIGGASKSGTTSMFRWLASHPEVSVASEKELRYFDGINLHRGPDWYASRFPEGDLVTGEASPRYMTDADPQHIDALLPDVKLLFLLREPVSRAYADYWMHRAVGKEARSFEEALEDPRTWERCVVTGEYHEHLGRFVDVFGEERVAVVLTDDMSADPVGTFEGVCRFLGITSLSTDVVGSVVNAGVVHRSLALRRLSRRLPPTARRVIGRINTSPLQPPPMDDATRDRLRAHFAPHNLALQRMLGRHIPWVGS